MPHYPVRRVSTTFLAALSAFALSGALPMTANAKQTYDQTYAADRAEIEDLMARYLFAIDYFDWDAYLDTFAPDGELEFASGTYKGHDAIREAVTSFTRRIGEFYHTEDGKPAKLRHVILQSSIRVDGDRGWARSQWVEMANNGPGDSLKMGTFGLYEDDLAKIDGRWVFTKRRVLNDFLPGRHSGPENPVAAMDRVAEASAR
jgi:hypothetical protein